MSVEYERLEMPMDLELKWVKTKLHERDKHIAKLAEENSKLREELREDIPDMETLARMSYNMADAMLERRNKNG